MDLRLARSGAAFTALRVRLTLAAADGFRLSTAYATLDTTAPDATATLERAGLLAFAKSLKRKDAQVATIDTDAREWRFAANGTAAAVRLIDGTYPDFSSIVGSGDEPVLFTVNPSYFRDVLSSHGAEPVHVARATDDQSAAPGLTNCNGVCRNLNVETANCGACGRACPGVNQACCSGVCRNLNRDENNCGACGNACAAGEICDRGACV